MRLPSLMFFALTVSVSAADLPSKYEQPYFKTASVYARGSDRKQPLFRLQRAVARTGNETKVDRQFSSSAPVVREHVLYQGDNLSFCDIEYVETGEKCSVRVARENGKAQLQFDYTSPSGKHKTNTEKFDPNTINNDMVGVFIMSHWKQLMNGDTVKCRYLAMTRAETVGFEFVKTGDTTYQGHPAAILKMAPSSSIIAAFVDPLIFTVLKDGKDNEHYCVQYDGRTPIKVKDGSKWKDLDALTVFAEQGNMDSVSREPSQR
jgi:hypothetical protein